jgi:hypothetical protein
MRKFSTRSVLLALLVITSICSYIYLNTVNVTTESANQATEVESTNEIDEQESELVLPDLRVVKKVLETGKKFIPAS